MNKLLLLFLFCGCFGFLLNSEEVLGAPGDTITTIDSSPNDVGKLPVTVIGTDGYAITTYLDSTTNEFKLIHCTNATCTSHDSPIVIDTVQANFNPASIAIGSDNFPVIAYRDYPDGLKILHCTSIDCSERDTPKIIDGIGAYPSIDIGIDGNPVIAYSDQYGLTVAHCLDVSCSLAPEITRFGTDEFNAYTAVYISLKVGNDTNPIIAYWTGTNLAVTHCTNISCSSYGDPQNLDSVDSIRDISLVIGSDTNPIISYALGFDDVMVVHCNNGTCSDFDDPVIVDDTIWGASPSIAIGSDNFPIISHAHHNSIKISHCKNVDCSMIDLPIHIEYPINSDAGYVSSIAIGSDNLPIISYYHRGNGDLKVAHCSTVNCSTFNPSSCIVPSGDWVISQSCTYYGFGDIQFENITVTNNSVLTVDGTWLHFDFKQYAITVEQGSGILIKNNGKIVLFD